MTREDRQQIVESLGRVAANWLDPEHPARHDAILALQVSTGFSTEIIESALEAAFAELTADKLREFLREDALLSGQASGQVPEKVLHILAGNVFTAWLPGAVITLLLGGECWLKSSSSEPTFAPLWKRSVAAVDPALAEKIQIVFWDKKLLSLVQAVVAYGSDETLATLRSQISPDLKWVGYGHKISAGIVFKEAQTNENRAALLETLCQDSQPFRLGGCLSPQIIYWEGGDPSSWQEILSARIQPAPVFKRFEDWESVEKELNALKPHLATLGYAGPSERLLPLRNRLEKLGFSRLCPLGEMQRPPLSWRNDGISLTAALCALK